MNTKRTAAWMVVGAMAGMVCACASLWATPQVADAAAQVACVNEAGTRAEAEACRCRVRSQYPDGPQCDAGADATPDAAKDGAR